MQVYCAGCGELHDEKERNAHRLCASNKLTPASNSASNVTSHASNRKKPEEAAHQVGGRSVAVDVSGRRDVLESTDSAPVVVGAGRKQRWSREAYNAYQRELMRKRRAQNS